MAELKRRNAISSLEDERQDLKNTLAINLALSPLSGGAEPSVIFISSRLNEINKKIYELRTQPLTGPDPLIGTLAPLGDPSNLLHASGLGVNGGNFYISGTSETATHGPYHAIRWTPAGGTVDLGTLVGAAGSSFGFGISGDGGTVVGTSSAGAQVSPPPFTAYATQHAFRWTAALGMTDLGTVDGASGYSAAYGTNGDGSVVVGQSSVAGRFQAFRWDLSNPATGAGSMTALGSLVPLATSTAFAVSSDGKVAVGNSAVDLTPSGFHAVRWVKGQAIQDLGVLPGHVSATAMAVSGDGSVIVGTSSPSLFGVTQYNVGGWTIGTTDRAFRWTQATGMKDLTGLMTAAGVNMTGITLLSATTVTADGQFIGGSAVFPTTAPGSTSAYLLRYCDATVSAACAYVQSLMDPVDPGAGNGAGSATGNNSNIGIGGFTSYASLQNSVDELGGRRANAAVQQHGIANMLMGQATPIAAPGAMSIFGAIGSVTGGGNVRAPVAEGLTVLGGISLGEQNYRDTKIRDAVTGAIALRYEWPSSAGGLRPFGEIGGFYARGDTQFSRRYLNGAGYAFGQGQSELSTYYGFGRAGLALDVSTSHEFAISVEGGRQLVSYDRYSEPFSPINPFNASFLAGTGSMNIGKVKGQWTWRFGEGIDATVAGAVVKSFDGHSGTAGLVAGAGLFTASVKDPVWYEYGARFGIRLDQRSALDLFLSGIAGNDQVAKSVHVGAGYRYIF